VSEATVLVVYYSRQGSTEALARQTAQGVESAGIAAKLRTLPSVSPVTEATAPEIPPSGPPYATLDDLRECDGLLLGSPTRFGNMAAPVKHFLDSTSELWLAGSMADKPAGVFTSSTSLHGGQESTLYTMVLPLVHHGMIWVGVPYTEAALFETRTGGSPYGATHIESDWNTMLSDDETRIARALGARVARIAQALSSVRV
jgi:NAD(P)H dehydrogenase (quinone)